MIKPEQWQKVLDAIASGLTNADAAIVAGMHQSTLYERIANDAEFSESVKKALIGFKFKHIKQVSDNASWQSSAWMLERKFKDEFAQRNELTGKDGEALKPVQIYVPANGREIIAPDAEVIVTKTGEVSGS